MKKVLFIFVLMALAFTVSCCSKDDGPSAGPSAKGFITLKADGVQKTFPLIKVYENVMLEGTPEEYTELYISAGTDHSGWSDAVELSIKKGDLSGNAVFTYIQEGDIGYITADNFTINVISNGDDKKLIGTFSGDMLGITDFTITEGIFNIQY